MAPALEADRASKGGFFPGDFWGEGTHPTTPFPPASTAEVVTLRFPKKLNQCKPETQVDA